MASKRSADIETTDESDIKKEKVEKKTDSESETDQGAATSGEDLTSSSSSSSTLDSATREFIEFIFDDEMFKDALGSLDIDVEKMPLDEISFALIEKGFAALEKLEEAIKEKKSEEYNVLSSKFYSVIPHKEEPTIKDEHELQEKYNMLNVLADVKLARDMKKDETDAEGTQFSSQSKYKWLNCQLKYLDNDTKDYENIVRYIMAKRGNMWRSAQLTDVWTVHRENEAAEYKKKDLSNRKLLWHCSHIASTAAILKTGLHLKPHCGGMIGHGIYFASDLTRAAVKAGYAKDKGIMFLCEVALGNEYKVEYHCRYRKSPPEWHDSIVTTSQRGPDKKKDLIVQMDGNDVAVPVGKQKQYSQHSWFLTPEYAIFNEDQYRLRYVLLFDNV